MTIKELRKEKKLTQQAAALYVGVPLRTYKRIENNILNKDSIKYEFIFNKLSQFETNVQKVKSYNTKHKNIAVIGGGYVGLANAVALSINNNVTIFDIDRNKRAYLKNNIENIVKKHNVLPYSKILIKNPREGSYKKPSLFIIALPTNYDEITRSFDMSIVLNCYKQIRNENLNASIVIRSTCVPGFCESLKDKNVLFSPEFLVENRSIEDELNPSRVIIASNYKTSKIQSYMQLVKGYANTSTYLTMGYREAECAKLFANAYLAMRVAYFNEVDNYALDNNVDTKKIIEGICSDPRIGNYYNNPSFGYGGYCLPKDTQCIANEMTTKTFFNSITESNEERKYNISRLIIKSLGSDYRNKVVGIYSLANKANSNAIRNSVVMDVINLLKKETIQIKIFNKQESLKIFCNSVDLILTNRLVKELLPYKNKCYTRDIFANN